MVRMVSKDLFLHSVLSGHASVSNDQIVQICGFNLENEIKMQLNAI